MMDISIEELMEKTGNIYEAVAVMSRRARQITDEQKQLIDAEMEIPVTPDNKENEDFDDVEIDREALMREHKKYPKPTRVAIEEMLEGKISHRYDDPSEEETEDKEKEKEKVKAKEKEK